MADNTNKKASNIFDSSLFLLIVIASVVVLNIILALPNTPSLRYDLTEDGLYTLSDASKGMVGGLTEDVKVKFFVSENLQYPDHNLEQRVADLLSEYEANSNGRFTFEIIHPEASEEAEKARDEGTGEDKPAAADGATEEPRDDPSEEGPKGFGIQKIPVGVRGDDQVGLRLVYKGLAMLAGDRTEVIKEVKGTDNLEYEISKRIKLLTVPEEARHKVGFVQGFGGPADSPEFVQGINQAFEQIYGNLLTATAVKPADGEIPPDVDALVILAPNQPVSDVARFRIDQFLMSGKGVAWLQTTMAPNPQMPMLPMRQPVVTGLNGQFKAYGLELHDDLILDRKNNIVGLVFTQRGLAQVSNPTMPIFTDIDRESVITRDIQMLSFPLSSSISVTAPALENADIKVVELVKAEPEAVRWENVASVDYDKVAEPQDGETKGAWLMAASLQGPMASAFTGQEVPAGVEAPARREKAETAARIVVVGNGDFMFPNRQTGYGNQYPSLGALFLLNMVDWLVQDEDLISIRSKGIPRVITEVETEEHSTYQIGNIVGVPALFGLLGILVWFARRQRRNALKL